MTNIPEEKRRPRMTFWTRGIRAAMRSGKGTARIPMSVLHYLLATRFGPIEEACDCDLLTRH